MWKLRNPFKSKRAADDNQIDTGNRAAFLITGNWENRTAFIESLVKSSNGRFLFAGLIMMDNDQQDHVELEFFEREIDLTEQFEIGSGYRIKNGELAAIKNHKSLVRIVTDVDEAEHLYEHLSRFTLAIRDAGGLAIKVECSGVAHPWQDWEAMLKSASPDDHYFALIAHVATDDTDLVSFGMSHHMKPDAQVLGSNSDSEQANVLSTFNKYQYLEHPVFEDGQTFSCGPGEQSYRLKWRSDDRYEEGNWFFNPFGVWQLSPLD